MPNPTNPSATFAYISSAILPKCTGCHNATSVAPQVDLSTYTAVMTQVTVGKPLNSNFFTYVAPGSPESMPLGAPALAASDQQAIFDWINNGAVAPAATPTPTPTPVAVANNCQANGMNSTLTGCGSMMVPTTYAVVARLVKVLGVNPTSGNFSTTLNQVKTSLPNDPNPTFATGFDQIPLIVYSACYDANASTFGVNTAATPATATPTLIAAGVTMVNAHLGNLAASGTTLNTQVTAVFTTLVNNDIAAGATTKQIFVSVCTTANTFGIDMTGF
jgi:hypothetical protein